MKQPHQGVINIHVPLVRTHFSVLYGERGRMRMNNWLAESEVKESVEVDDYGGYANGSVFWVCDITNHSDIVHELHHVSNNISKEIGVDSEEFEAYLQGFLYDELMKRLKKRGHHK